MELTLQRYVCDYLRLHYPQVFFRSDYAAGLKLTVGQATMHKRLQASRAWPDLFIAEPAHGYNGLFIELKRETTRVWLRDGSLTVDPHIREQLAMLAELKARGYSAVMAVGFEEARRAIDEYLA